MINAKKITKKYGGLAVLDNVSFRIQQGEVFGFLGPDGAGKTTLMRILAGFIPATSGAVSVAGYDVSSESMAVRRSIGYLPENVPLYEEMRVKEYLRFRAKIKGIPRGRRKGRMASVMTSCGITDVASRPIRHLSKGHRRRVGLADALIHDPQILILDEPTIGLEPDQIREVRELIKQLGTRRTIILSTHILSEVEMICRRFFIMNAGKIVAEDTMENLREKSQSLEELFVSRTMTDPAQ